MRVHPADAGSDQPVPLDEREDRLVRRRYQAGERGQLRERRGSARQHAERQLPQDERMQADLSLAERRDQGGIARAEVINPS